MLEESRVRENLVMGGIGKTLMLESCMYKQIEK